MPTPPLAAPPCLAVTLQGATSSLPGVPSADLIQRAPLERWDLDLAEALPGGDPLTLSAQFGAFMADIDLFDAAAYALSATEAAAMDPQHRYCRRVDWGSHFPARQQVWSH